MINKGDKPLYFLWKSAIYSIGLMIIFASFTYFIGLVINVRQFMYLGVLIVAMLYFGFGIEEYYLSGRM